MPSAEGTSNPFLVSGDQLNLPIMLRPRIFHLPIKSGGKSFRLNGISGKLLSIQGALSLSRSTFNLAAKMQCAWQRCENPYLLSAPSDETSFNPSTPTSPEAATLGSKFAEKLILRSRRQFLCARLYASLRVPLFASAREAILFFRQHAEGDQEELCLARALFAAKTSRMFADHGAVVIGVFLPSRAMHAWVIEGDELADPYDGIWINYQPVAMLS